MKTPAEEVAIDWKALTKDERHALMSRIIRLSLAMQISANRKARGWTQAELAKRTGLYQSQIVRFENPLGGNISIDSLKRIARAFDVALIVRFSSWSGWIAVYSSELVVESFGDDLAMEPAP